MAVALFVVAMARTVFLQAYWHTCFVVGMRLRTAVTGIVYRKVGIIFTVVVHLNTHQLVCTIRKSYGCACESISPLIFSGPEPYSIAVATTEADRAIVFSQNHGYFLTKRSQPG